MEYSVGSGSVTTRKSPCLVAAVYQGGVMPEATRTLDKATGGTIKKRLHDAFTGKPGEHLLLFDPPAIKAERLLLVGLGEKKKFNLAALRKAAATATRALDTVGVAEASSLLAALSPEGEGVETVARAIVEASEHAAYRFERMKSAPPERRQSLKKMILYTEAGAASAARRGIATGLAVARGVALARDLGNLPANVCTPIFLASEARKLARKYPALKVRVLTETDIQKLGMGDLWGVARGSRQPPRLIVFEYSGGKKGAKPLALVGKGVT
ncbi:MAG: M17 family peptidase N-terminal domain-containing protein, partial [Gammaproteobacteria bacterium]